MLTEQSLYDIVIIIQGLLFYRGKYTMWKSKGAERIQKMVYKDVLKTFRKEEYARLVSEGEGKIKARKIARSNAEVAAKVAASDTLTVCREKNS